MNRKKSKRANGDGSVYRLKSGKWRVTVTVGRTSEGKQIRKSRVFDRQTDANIARDEMRQLATINVVESRTLTVGAAIADWLEEVKEAKGENNTHDSYRRACKKHILPRIGSLILADLRAVRIRRMLTEMAVRTDDGEPLVGDRTRQLCFTVLSIFLKRCARLGMIVENPCNRLERPKWEREPIRPFTADQARKIIIESAGTRYHGMMYLGFSCGMRQGEILGLPKKNVDLKKKSVFIETQIVEVAGQRKEGRPKTKSSIRTVMLTDAAALAMQDHQALTLKCGHAGADLFFPNKLGKAISKRSFRIFWNGMLKKLCIPHRGFHHARHTYASLALGAGVPVHVVSKILGHASVSITLNLYSHMLPEQQIAATDAMSEILGQPPEDSGSLPVADSKKLKTS